MKKALVVSTVLLFFKCAAAYAQSPAWSFYVDLGAGTNSATYAEKTQIPDAARKFLATKGIYDVGIEPDHVIRLGYSASIGASMDIPGKFSVSAQVGSQNITQKNYKAAGFTAAVLVGHGILGREKHACNELSIEAGAGVCMAFSHYYLSWRGQHPDGSIVITSDGPEVNKVDLGKHDTSSPMALCRFRYSHCIGGGHWAGAYLSIGANLHSGVYMPVATASIGIQYRYALTIPVKHPMIGGTTH